MCVCDGRGEVWGGGDMKKTRVREKQEGGGRQLLKRGTLGDLKSNRKIGMKSLSDVDVLLMTHLGDNMQGALLLEEDWPRVNDSPLPGATPSQLTRQPESQDLPSPPLPPL